VDLLNQAEGGGRRFGRRTDGGCGSPQWVINDTESAVRGRGPYEDIYINVIKFDGAVGRGGGLMAGRRWKPGGWGARRMSCASGGSSTRGRWRTRGAMRLKGAEAGAGFKAVTIGGEFIESTPGDVPVGGGRS